MSDTITEAAPDPNTGAGLIKFLDAAIEKGWFNVSSAKALKTASQKILSVESGWETMDLRQLDVDGLFERFRNLRHLEYSDDSMRIYKTRFTQALKMHLAKIDGEPDWKSHGPGGKASSSKNGGNGTSSTKRTPAAKPAAPSQSHSAPDSEEPPPARLDGQALMRFPFPLRENVDVSLSLPRDLTKAEAERLSAFINSLARDTSS